MGRIATIAVLLATLAACAQYSLVEAKKQKIGSAYTVEAQIAWNKHSEGKVELWTVDGPALEAVRFFKGLSAGDTLFQRPRGAVKEVKSRPDAGWRFPSHSGGERRPRRGVHDGALR